MTVKKLFKWLGISLLGYLVLGVVLHHVVFPEPRPDLSRYPSAGEAIENPFARERLVFVRTGPETNWQYTENDCYLMPGGAIPRAHVHAAYEETFTVRQGRLSLRIDGEKRSLGPGESVTIPRGTPHHPFNDGDQEAIFRVRATPAGQHDLLLTQGHGFLTERTTPRSELESLLQAMICIRFYETYAAGLPITIQKGLSFIISPTARLLGYRTWRPDYVQKWKSGV